jgi:hypothetical protein
MVCFYTYFLNYFSLLVQDIIFQLHRFITALDKYHTDCNEIMKEADIFPIEVDLNLPIFLRREDNNDDGESDEENNDDNNQQQPIEENFDLLNIGD